MLNNSVRKYLLKLAGPRVSIDFNDTFNTPRGAQLARELKSTGFDVFIVTRLNSRNSDVVEKKAAEVGINPDHIFYTNGAAKWPTLQRLQIRRHYDNNQKELDLIKKFAPEIKTVKF